MTGGDASPHQEDPWRQRDDFGSDEQFYDAAEEQQDRGRVSRQQSAQSNS